MAPVCCCWGTLCAVLLHWQVTSQWTLLQQSAMPPLMLPWLRWSPVRWDASKQWTVSAKWPLPWPLQTHHLTLTRPSWLDRSVGKSDMKSVWSTCACVCGNKPIFVCVCVIHSLTSLCWLIEWTWHRHRQTKCDTVLVVRKKVWKTQTKRRSIDISNRLILVCSFTEKEHSLYLQWYKQSSKRCYKRCGLALSRVNQWA